MGATLQEYLPREGRWRVLVDVGAPLCEEVPISESRTQVCLSLSAKNFEPSTGAFQESDLAIKKCGAQRVKPDRRIGSIVRLRGLSATPDLNGTEGRIVGFSVEDQRWQVILSNGSGKLLKSEHIECLADLLATRKTKTCYCPGMIVRIVGLTSRPDLNGQEGKLLELDDEDGRWRVVMRDGSGLSLRPTSLELVARSLSEGKASREMQRSRSLSIDRRSEILGMLPFRNSSKVSWRFLSTRI